MTMALDRTRIGRPAPHRSVWAMAGTAIVDVVTMLAVWHERAFQRRQLLALGDRALRDFACSRAEAAREGGKPFWRP
jgi:uncharacterized protein YjiS (DUF1127 family)